MNEAQLDGGPWTSFYHINLSQTLYRTFKCQGMEWASKAFNQTYPLMYWCPATGKAKPYPGPDYLHNQAQHRGPYQACGPGSFKILF